MYNGVKICWLKFVTSYHLQLLVKVCYKLLTESENLLREKL